MRGWIAAVLVAVVVVALGAGAGLLLARTSHATAPHDASIAVAPAANATAAPVTMAAPGGVTTTVPASRATAPVAKGAAPSPGSPPPSARHVPPSQQQPHNATVRPGTMVALVDGERYAPGSRYAVAFTVTGVGPPPTHAPLILVSSSTPAAPDKPAFPFAGKTVLVDVSALKTTVTLGRHYTGVLELRATKGIRLSVRLVQATPAS